MWKKWLIISILIVLLLPGINASHWDYYNHDVQNTSSTTDNGPEPPLKFLWNPEKLRIGGDWLTPIVHGNVVYLVRSFRSTTFRVMAINISDGKILWSTKGSGIWTGAWSAFYMSGMIYIDTGWYNGVIECINATNGKVVWDITGIFSSNMIPTKKGIYFLKEVKDNDTNIPIIVAVNPLTGKEKSEVEMRGANFSLYYTYIGLSGNVMYVFHDCNGPKGYSEKYSVYAFDITTGCQIWRYDIKNHASYLQNSPMIVGKDMLYIPVWLEHKGGGIAAINKTTGKLVWMRITDLGFDDFQYKFAYSPEYHMIVRLTVMPTYGNLTAFDSRDGHLLWVANRSYKDVVLGVRSSTPVIANNYIYIYGDGWSASEDLEEYGTVLRMYNITNGKIIYQTGKMGYPSGSEITLDTPCIAVANGMVFIPHGYLYVLIHENATNDEGNMTIAYLGMSALVVGSIIAAVFIARKKNIAE